MTAYSSKCITCQQLCDWIECPTGGWWAHRLHPADGHDAKAGWQPMERMTDKGDWRTI